jgi:hypothetical protein
MYRADQTNWRQITEVIAVSPYRPSVARRLARLVQLTLGRTKNIAATYKDISGLAALAEVVVAEVTH